MLVFYIQSLKRYAFKMPKFTQMVEFHKAEVQFTLSQVVQLPCHTAPKKYHPSRYSPFIWSEVTGQQVREWCRCKEGVGHSIRQVHDYYGWMAKDGPRGGCKGALYRTVKFMEIEAECRDGTKQETKNIHIEHTVPIQVLRKFLSYNHARFRTPGQLHSSLISNSICVAMTHEEQNALDSFKDIRSSNPAYNSLGERVGDFPFLRYGPLLDSSIGRTFKIVNVVTGKEINIHTSSFLDHETTLVSASKLVSNANNFDAYSLNLFDSSIWSL